MKSEVKKKKKSVLDFVTEKTKALIEAPTCSSEAKAAAKAWLEAAGTDREAEETKAYLKELEEDIMPIDQLIAFASSDQGRQYFGAEKAEEIAAHGKEIKASGGKYCDCPACAIVAEILEKKEQMQ